jgi:tRNA threonylcarbamoyladenosine biosynthesis protein TsaE
MKKEIIVTTEIETLCLGEHLGKLLHKHSLLTLYGDLGAGKTTFAKGIGKGLGVTSIMNSPTFTILKQYLGRIPVSHFDAYRLEGQDDDLGFEEIFESDDVCIVEWADFISNILPKEQLQIEICKIDETSRRFIFTPIGVKYEQICQELEL